MTSGRLLLIPLAALTLAASASAAPAKSPGLVGEVGPGFKIQVELNGRHVKTLKAGTYRITIEDKSSAHNFHLIGPGVNRSTTVAFTGKKRWTVKLRTGTYRFQCDPHASFGMKGSFKVKG